ncbi:hypothetical protein [Frigoribacterium salinisoli]
MNHHIEFVSRDHSGITTVVTSDGVLAASAVVADIQSGRATYVAGPTSWDLVPVTAWDAFGGAYLYANWDGTRRNNLHDLAAAGTGERQARRSARVRSPWGRLVQLVAAPSAGRDRPAQGGVRA